MLEGRFFLMSRFESFSRRAFLGASLASCAAVASGRVQPVIDEPPSFPLNDLHVHLDNSTIDDVVLLGLKRQVHFGVVEHAGTRENKYPGILSNDEELKSYLKKLEDKGVYRGIQAEWTDWMSCFSREVLAELDYILTDAMTFPGKDGRRVKLWEKGAEDQVDMSNHEHFMDRFVDWHVQIMEHEPIDILANASWLPGALLPEYETLWTERRIKKVLDAALRDGVAIEISANHNLPHLQFLKQAQAAGVKFTFGSDGRYPEMGKLDYSVKMASMLGLGASDVFTPGIPGERAIDRRKS
jgi:histidinol phosphatase-like PHP family hydrolase